MYVCTYVYVCGFVIRYGYDCLYMYVNIYAHVYSYYINGCSYNIFNQHICTTLHFTGFYLGILS